jgi:5-methylcytosine-specific restriction endonuclease McrA
MNGKLPAGLPDIDPCDRLFPHSWRDAAIRVLMHPQLGGVVCPRCGIVFRGRAELRRLEADHDMPYSQGGLTTWANLVILCRPCNRRKHAKVAGDYVLSPSLPGDCPSHGRGTLRESSGNLDGLATAVSKA